MSTILIDKLLETVVVRGASDLHLAVGQPPVLRLHGRLVKLETKSLEPADTVSLMKSITPQRCQQELQERGGTDFGFAFGTKARFRVSVFKQKGNPGLVLRQIPTELLSMEQLGTPAVMHDLIRSLKKKNLWLDGYFRDSRDRSECIAKFIGILELLKSHIVALEDDGSGDEGVYAMDGHIGLRLCATDEEIAAANLESDIY